MIFHLEHRHEDNRACIPILKCSDKLWQNLVAANILREVVQLGNNGTKNWFFSPLSLIWISSRKRRVSTRSFLK
jgi:hypothetical protein